MKLRPTLLSRALPSALFFASPSLQAHYWGEEAIALIGDQWPAAFSAPNATANITIPGYNITRPYAIEADEGLEDDDPSDDWTLRIAVQADLPLPDPSDPSQAFFTGTEISYRPPRSLWPTLRTNGSDPSWYICEHYYRATALTWDDEDEELPSDCGNGFLPDDCVEDLREKFIEGFGVDSPGAGPSASSGNKCADMILPDSCKDAFGDDEDEENNRKLLSGASTWSPSEPSFGVRYGVGNHSYGDTSRYDEAIRQVWVAAIVWGAKNDSRDTQPPTGSLSCIRAGDVKEGSRRLEDAAAGLVRGTGRDGPAWAALVVAAIVVALTM